MLVSVFLFSLEGEEEDCDLVIAKGLGPTDQQEKFLIGIQCDSHFGFSWLLQLFI